MDTELRLWCTNIDDIKGYDLLTEGSEWNMCLNNLTEVDKKKVRSMIGYSEHIHSCISMYMYMY
jgi:hypothetical protein